MARRLTPTEKLARTSDQFNSVHELDEKKIEKIADPTAQAQARAALQRHRSIHQTSTGQVFKGEDGDWYWHVTTNNGQIVATGGEGYRNQGDAVKMANRFASEVEVQTEA